MTKIGSETDVGFTRYRDKLNKSKCNKDVRKYTTSNCTLYIHFLTVVLFDELSVTFYCMGLNVASYSFTKIENLLIKKHY